VTLDLDRINYAPADMEKLCRGLDEPNGIVLVTGPTGSGKTTALYACPSRIDTERSKVMSIEDPVEYILPGVVQIPVNAGAGVTFGIAMRSVLRSDPDVVMVGEIRDAETMNIAFQMALTGHLVLTTLHTDEAASALTRMLDIGGAPFLVSDSVKLVLAQRLVRTLCPDCSVSDTPSPEAIGRAAQIARNGGLNWGAMPKAFRRPRGCVKCRKLGFRGRQPIVECLEITPEIAAAVRRRAEVDELRALAVSQGMTTMAADGLRRAAAGQTTLDEVFRVLALR